MDDAAIGWGGLALSLILVGVAVGLSVWQGLRLEREILWACGRAIAQLLAVGYLLVLVIDEDAPVIWAWLWVVAMVGFAAVTVRRRAPEIPGVLGLAALAVAASAAVSLLVVFGLGVYPNVARAVVPIAGMMIGNSIGGLAVAARRIGIPTLVGPALRDPAVPPPGQFAVYNALGGPKELYAFSAGHLEYAAQDSEDSRFRAVLRDWLLSRR